MTIKTNWKLDETVLPETVNELGREILRNTDTVQQNGTEIRELQSRVALLDAACSGKQNQITVNGMLKRENGEVVAAVEGLDYVGTADLDQLLSRLPRIAAGRVEITPTAPNTPTRVYIRFPEGLFRSAPSITVTIVTAVPGTAALGASASEANKDGFYLYLTRNDRTQTGVYWQAIQLPE